MKENIFQKNLIKEIKKKFPNSLIWKLDPKYRQGSPDLLILNGSKWATLECKANSNSPHQPNQDYYVDLMNEMSYSNFVCPENKEEVLNDLEKTFRDS